MATPEQNEDSLVNKNDEGRNAQARSNGEYDCPVCFEFCAQPVTTPCQHFFCLQCQRQVTENNLPCPLCRAHFDRSFIPTVDRDLQSQIKNEKSKEFERRKAELEEAGLWIGNNNDEQMMMVTFLYGNTHEMIERDRNPHRWSMFVTVNSHGDEQHRETAKYIQSVTYKLHPTFRTRVIKVKEAPFLLSRRGWGYFRVHLKIKFQEWTKLPRLNLHHELCFEGGGKTQSVVVRIDSKQFPQTSEQFPQTSEHTSGEALL